MSGWRVHPDVAWLYGADFLHNDHAVYAMVVPDGEPLVLGGSAAMVWEAALNDGDTVELVAWASGADPAEIAPHVAAFLFDLVARGLLIPTQETTDA